MLTSGLCGKCSLESKAELVVQNDFLFSQEQDFIKRTKLLTGGRL